MKENSILNWRSMSTKISIKSCMCYAEVRTKDGLEYEPESLKSMLAALDWHLKEHDYKCSIMRDREFYQSRLVLEGKVKHLHQQGKGKRPNAASVLTAEEEESMNSQKKEKSIYAFRDSLRRPIKLVGGSRSSIAFSIIQ